MEAECGRLTVVENAFHYRQDLVLVMGDNVVGREVKGHNINQPILTVDPSVDTRHCIIQVKRNKQGKLQFLLRDAPSGTGTWLNGEILRDHDRAPLSDEDIITIGATTMIFSAP